jgi:hypothetical protein
MTLSVDMQIWSLLARPPNTIASIASSMLASWRTITGAFPPSSKTHFFQAQHRPTGDNGANKFAFGEADMEDFGCFIANSVISSAGEEADASSRESGLSKSLDNEILRPWAVL